MPATSPAQWVDFSTTSLPTGPACDARIFLGDGTPVSGTGVVAQLYYGPSASSLVAHPSAPVRFRASTTSQPGLFSGGGRDLFGLSTGSVAVLAIRVWPVLLAATYEEAVAAGLSTYDSGPFYYEIKPAGLPVTNYSMLGFCERNAFARLGDTCSETAFPTLLNQPQSQTVARGADVTLTAIVTNRCLGHWRFNGSFIGPGAIDVPGWQDGSNYLYHSLVMTNVQPAHAGSYQFVAENYAGSVTSQVALLTVDSPPQWGGVEFANDVFIPQRLVSWFGGELLTGTNFLAQLFYGTNAFNLIAVTNPPATFRRLDTSQPGTWIGGRRTLVGVLPGTPVSMQVRIWDGNLAGTYEEAEAAGAVLGHTTVFSYTPPPPDSPVGAYYMLNFAPPSIHCGPFGPPAILEQPTSQVASIGQDVVLSIVRTNSCLHEWQFNGTNLSAVNSWKLKIYNVQPHHEGDYRVIIKQFGSSQPAVTSQVARLTVRPPPQFTATRSDNGAFAFHVLEDTGRAVVIETAPDLNPGTTWTSVITNTAPFSFTNSTPADRQRYYRTVIR